MASLSIKNVPDEVVARLRAQAASNNRSLQGELLTIVTEAAGQGQPFDAVAFLAESRRPGFSTPDESAAMIREIRDSDDGRH